MITVIADDITGAAEIAGVCLRFGLEVSFGIDAIPIKDAQITVIATDSRSFSEEEAYQLHLQLTKKVIQKNKNQIIFKKCDSVLRGHILTELAASMDASGKEIVLLQPSNPISNRCINEGMYYVNDVEIKMRLGGFTSIKKQEMRVMYVVDAAFPDRLFENGIDVTKNKAQRD